MRLIFVRFEWKLADMWVGLYWSRERLADMSDHLFHVWVCFLPCIPLHICWKVRA